MRPETATELAFRRLAAPLLFLVGTAVQAAAAQPAPSPNRLVSALASAVDSGLAERRRRDLEARLERNPGDREAALGLATLDRLTYRFDRADRLFRSLAAANPADRWTVHALLGLGQSHTDRSRFREASEAFDRARLASASMADSAAESAALGAQAALVARAGDLDSAIGLMTRARRFASPADSDIQSQLDCGEASIILGRQPARADSLADRGVALARARSDRRAVGRCLVVKASTAAGLGRSHQSVASLLEAVRMLDSTSDWAARGTAYQHLAYQYARFSYSTAVGREMAQRAIAAADRSGNRLVRAWATLNLAQVALRVGDVRAAVQGLATARATMDSVGDRSGALACDYVRAEAAFQGGDREQAEKLFRAIVDHYGSEEMFAAQVPPLFRLAALALARGQPSAAREILDRAGQIARKTRIGIETDQLYFVGLIALMEGHWGLADSALQAFADRMRASASYHYVFDAELRRAEALARAGRPKAATDALDSAYAMPERIWHQLAHHPTDRDLEFGLMADRRYEADPDLGLATTLGALRRLTGSSVAFRYAEAQRARVLLTQMIRRGTLGADSVDYGPRSRAMYPAAVNLEELEAALDDSTALVEFVAGRGSEASLAFVVRRDGISTYDLASGDSLIEPIQRFVTLLEGGVFARPLARRLGRLVLDSVIAGLPARVRRLIIVPDGPLHRLPFDALLDGDDRLMLERYAISLAPSGRLAASWMRARSSSSPGTLVAFGDPTFDPSSGLPRLPGSALEIRQAASHVSGAVVLVGAQASEAAFKRRRWERAGVLHLATHAEVEDWGVLSSALQLAPGGGEDGRVGPEEIAALRIPVDLVVLSGCRTAGGVVLFAEGLQGLAAPFLEAGARSILATYWAVGDRRMVPLMDRLYRELATGQTVQAAVVATKRAALRAGDSPAAWASLALIGAPDLRPLARNQPER